MVDERSELTGIIDQIFRDFTECSSFLSEIYDHTTATLLSFLHSFFDSKNQVRTTGANVGTEHITTVTFVMDAQSKLDIRVGHLCGVAEDIHCQPSNWRQEDFDVSSGNEFWKRSTGDLKECTPQSALIYNQSS